MDSTHQTEFASEAYFEKLNQHNAQQQRQWPSQDYNLPSSSSTASQFILPLRESNVAEARPSEQKKEKSRFFGLRHKVSRLHSKPTVPPSVPFFPQPSTSSSSKPRVRPSVESAREK
jgi:hypothetical protein